MSVDWQGAAFLADVRGAVMRGVVRYASAVEEESVRLILDTPKTGRIYTRRGVEHQASAPGEAPASDTGRLVNSRRIDIFPEDLKARLIYSTEYAEHLQFGTEKMEPRPWLDRALDNTKEQALDFISAEVRAVV